MGNAGEDGGVGNLITIQVKNGQHRPVPGRVDKLIGMPGGGQGAGFRLPIAGHAGDDQVGIIQHGAVGMGDTVAQFPPLMDRAGGFWGDVATNVTGEGELLEEALQPFPILAFVGVNLRVGTLQVHRPQHPGGAMAGPGHKDHIQVVLLD